MFFPVQRSFGSAARRAKQTILFSAFGRCKHFNSWIMKKSEIEISALGLFSAPLRRRVNHAVGSYSFCAASA
jgi:hypothetical protein